ncbi:uncharacterized protein LTR77_000488 [Saxophila tyrrhenica]|uniref:3-phytase n=1 Tax=Saxophila tyrrhenica TaxID=1690608 RepID=A0AAV9PN49_9PEZI|nr:hypothetical protein LTR77_000488 [Saxophila tyrrhenica]
MASTLIACFAVLALVFFPDFYPFTSPLTAWRLASKAPGQEETAGVSKAWDLRYHLGGNGPWIPKLNGTTGGNINVPKGCKVEQVHMISRHAERYPTVPAGLKMLDLYNRIQEANVTLHGDLAFANDWNFFTSTPADHFESLVSTGIYAGTLEAFQTGVKLRTRYKDLLDDTLIKGRLSFWASDSERVVDTAQYFAAGCFGIDWQDLATLHIIPETTDRGGDTLTPGRTCLRYREDMDGFGHGYGYRMTDEFRSTYEPTVVNRLAEDNPDFLFVEDEIFTMQLMCGFETISKGSSPWCAVFTQEEMESFEYARDVIHYYRAGPGNPYSASLGWLWLNATANLLREGPEVGQMLLSFVHDGDIIPLLSALDLLQQTPDLPVAYVLHNRTWRTSDIVPMGGRLIFERLSCAQQPHCWSNAPFYPNHVYCEEQKDEIFVRLNINDGIVAIPECDDGPGSSCPLEMFLYRVLKRGSEIDEFRYICGLGADAPNRITFLHQ